jgi:hypothetical protein
MKKIKISLMTCAFLTFLIVTVGLAQSSELNLKMSRDWGYGGFNGDIQGLFSMKVTGPADLVKVIFYIDNASIGEVRQAPFNLQFSTDNYPNGTHEMYAIGYSSNGQEYHSNVITGNFVPASEGGKAALGIVLPLVVIIFGAILLAFLIPLLTGKGKLQELPLGAERKYGVGGGICPKCHRPFALPLFSMNLGFSKLARCPYCGKWSIVRIQSHAKLHEAEQAELEWGRAEVPEASADEKLRKELDDSKYQGM